jgi:hypothetical protein
MDKTTNRQTHISERRSEGKERAWHNYETWQAQVPKEIRQEAPWQFYGYRKALFSYDVCWQDSEVVALLVTEIQRYR